MKVQQLMTPMRMEALLLAFGITPPIVQKITNTNSCTTLPGTASFTASTGVLDWTPNYSTNDTSATWEIKITGTANGASSDAIFVITVNNNDRPPVLSGIADQSVNENSAISTVNANDANTLSGDTDQDGEAITYTCFGIIPLEALLRTPIAVRHYQEQQLLRHLVESWIGHLTIRPMIPAQLGKLRLRERQMAPLMMSFLL